MVELLVDDWDEMWAEKTVGGWAELKAASMGDCWVVY